MPFNFTTMYPTLGHLFSDLLGIPVNLPIPSYGTLLALAFLGAYLILRLEMKRKEKDGVFPSSKKKVTKGKPASALEILVSALLSGLIGLKLTGIIFDYSTFTEDVPGYIISLQGSWIGAFLFALVSGLYTWWSKKKEQLPEPKIVEETVHPHQLSGNILLIAAIAGIVGAKIFHQFEYPEQFFADPIGALLSSGGLTFYGGLICGAAAIVWYARKNKLPLLHIMDVAAPAVMIAYAIGREGCMVSGDGCWGVANTLPKPEWLAFLPDWMWAFDFPHNVVNEGVLMHSCSGNYCHVLDQPVWPTSFYESMMALLFFGVLWILRKRIKAPGVLFFIFLIFNGVARFLIEKIRVNVKTDFLNLTQAEIISSVLILIGIGGMIYFSRRYRLKKA